MGTAMQPNNNQNAGKCPHCRGLISVIDTINHIANNGLRFTHKCRKCGKPYKAQASIKLTTTASK
jgi:C4-type Zn-finger protein